MIINMADTFLRNSQGAQRYVGFFLVVLSGGDWLRRQTSDCVCFFPFFPLSFSFVIKCVSNVGLLSRFSCVLFHSVCVDADSGAPDQVQ